MTTVSHTTPVGQAIDVVGAARFESRSTMSSVVIFSAYGDIDATNASALTDYALALVNSARCRGLILDLSGLEFFGTDGFSALHRVSVRCARTGTGWVVVPGAAVSRLLQLCDPHGSLPAVGTVGAALANLQEQPHRPLRRTTNYGAPAFGNEI